MEVNFNEKTALLTMKDDKTMQQEPVEAALKGAGYGVTRFEAIAEKH